MSNYCPIRNRPSAWDKLDPEEVGKIRQEIHDEFKKCSQRGFLDSGFPTLQTMYSKIHALPDMSPFGYAAFRSILAHMGFKFRKPGGKIQIH